VGIKPAEGNPPNELGSFKTKAEIEALGVRYADGSDAIGRGEVAEGKQIYASVFTEDAVISVSLPNHIPNTPPDISTVGPDAWADFVSTAFTFLGYTTTQHHIGNVQVTVEGNTATMKSYLTATHVIDPNTHVVMTTGVYTDHVVHTPEGWRIAERNLQNTSIMSLTGTPFP
jgi:hypothetical protein